MNSSQPERFEAAYRRLWRALHRMDDPDLSQHERSLLHHVPRKGGVPLGWVAQHMALPKSSTSVLVKDLARRGFIRRERSTEDERRLELALTAKGARRVAQDRVLDLERLGAALAGLSRTQRDALLTAVERLAEAGEALPPKVGSSRPTPRIA